MTGLGCQFAGAALKPGNTWLLVIVLFGGICFPGPSGSAQELQETADPYYNPQRAGLRTADSQKMPPRVDGDNQFHRLSPTPQNPGAGGEFRPADSKNRQTDFEESVGPGESRITPYVAPTEPAESILPGQRFEPGQVLARVGGHPIFVSDLMVEARQIIDQFIENAPESVKQTEMRKLFPRLLPKYIQGKTLYVDVVNDLPEGVKVEDILKSAGEQFDEAVLPELLKQSGVESTALLDAHYRSMGSSLRSTRQNWAENEIVKYMIRSKINVNPEVSHRELFDAYLEEREEKWALPARVRWERLVVRFDRFPSKQAARDAIAAMGNEVVYGAPLAAVAKRSSQGALADEGGMQGWTTRGSLADKELEKLLFTIEPDQLSDIHESARGFEIVRVLERTEAGYVPFEEAQPEIRKKLVDQKREVAFKEYIDSVRERVPVEVFDFADDQQ